MVAAVVGVDDTTCAKVALRFFLSTRVNEFVVCKVMDVMSISRQVLVTEGIHVYSDIFGSSQSIYFWPKHYM